MKQILIIQNSHEEAGVLEILLNERNIPHTVQRLNETVVEPLENSNKYGAIVVLGGPDSANDDTKKMHSELAFIRQALAQNVPYLGICLGLQTLVKAAGGVVVKNPTREVGLRDPNGKASMINLTSEGKNDPLFAGLTDQFHVFHLHGETVEITPSMMLLGTGPFCHNQVVRVAERAYGLQCHFELTPEMFEDWVTSDPDLLLLDTEKLRSDFANIKEEYTNVGRKLFENFLHIAGY